MKIINRGVPPQENLFRFTCSNCKSLLECKQGEMKHYSDQRDGEWWNIDCPVCQNKCYVYSTSRVKNASSNDGYNERNF